MTNALDGRQAEDADSDGDLHLVQRGLTGLRLAVGTLLLVTLPVSERVLGFHVQYAIAVPAMAIVFAGNVLVAARAKDRRMPSRTLAMSLALDLLGVFAVLAASGGAANPWSALFLVHIALAAAILPRGTTIGLSALAASLFLALFAMPSGSCCANHSPNSAFSTHLFGMWFAFALSAGMIAMFVTRVRSALEARGREIARLRREAEENSRFRALATLAAGTAHELNTPLGTIAVLAYELSDHGDPQFVEKHARAIGAQVDRCREVITRLQAGATKRALIQPAEVENTVLEAIAAWRAAHPDAKIEMTVNAAKNVSTPLSSADLDAALGALLDNAWFASRAVKTTEPMKVLFDNDAKGPFIAVEDAGEGIAEGLQDRLGEPFVTTKEPGQGMGLGLWLVRRTIEEAGGKLEISSRSPRGTRVVMRLPELAS
jgi:two-component system, sensor histidine kinase RegB